MSIKLSKVLISDAVDSSCRDILESAGISVDYKPGLSKADLLSIIKVRALWRLGNGWCVWWQGARTLLH